MTGRPVPFALKVLRGNPGRRPLKPEPQPPIEAAPPPPPDFLTGHARAKWLRLAPQLHALGLLTSVDHDVFAAYCDAFGRWLTAEETLTQMAARDMLTRGLMIKTASGNVIQNPVVGIKNVAARDMVRFGTDLGLSPAARARLATDPSSAPDQGKFAGLIDDAS